MNTHTLRIVVVSAVALVGAAWAGKEKAEPLRLELDLADGSRVVGTPDAGAVSLVTPCARLNVPWSNIVSLTTTEDGKTAALVLRDGDCYQGAIELRRIKLDTIFGKIKVGLEQVREVRVELCSPPLPRALRRGLILYCPFDRNEGGRVADKSGRGNDGLAEGVEWVAEEMGGAVRLGGPRSAIRIPHSASLNTPDALSVFVRVKGSRLSWSEHANVAGALVNKFDSNSRDPARAPTDAGGWFLQVHAWKTPGEASCGLWHGATGSATSGNSLVADDEWHQIGLVYVGGGKPSVKLYVDGRDDGMSQQGGTIPSSIRNTDRDLYIGRWVFDGIHPPFRGEIDDVMIYNRELTSDEVRQLHETR